MQVRPDLVVHRLAIDDRDASAKEGGKVDFYTFALANSLLPAANAALKFDLELDNPGFKNGSDDTEVVYNGTFFHSDLLPHVGYNPHGELETTASVRNTVCLPGNVWPTWGSGRPPKQLHLERGGLGLARCDREHLA